MLDYIIDRFLMAMCALSIYNMTSSFSRYIDAKCLSIYAQELRQVAIYDGVKEGLKSVRSLIPTLFDIFTLQSDLGSETGPTDLNEESHSSNSNEDSHELNNDLHELNDGSRKSHSDEHEESHEHETSHDDEHRDEHEDSHGDDQENVHDDYTVRYEDN